VADRFTPLTIAALLAWILCVCVHEFAHALVAYWGGDQSVRRRGYLSLDPTKYIDPMFSLIVPAVVLLLGGLPLPGGAVRIDEGALRNRRWIAYVSAAGPVGNLVLFLLFSLPLHPKLGLVEPSTMVQPTWALFCGAMAFLNFIAAMFNLIPVPPLDGYRLIEHRLPADLQWKLRQPQMAMVGFGLLFLAFAVFDWVWIPFLVMHDLVTGALGLPTHLILSGYTYVILGAAG
jgi:Zn-dependent protease